MSVDAEVVARIVTIIRTFKGSSPASDGPVTAETSIVRDLKFDSLSVMDFVMAVETEFDVIIPIDTISEIETVGDLATRLQATSGRRAG